MRALLFSFFLLSSASSMALETDNYLSWGKNLSDSAPHINRYFSETIAGALEKIPDHEKSCEAMTALIAEEFESHLVHDNPVENWLFSVLTKDEMFPTGLNYVGESIYREPYRFYIPWFGLAPTIQVNGYYFGTDKLSHFASTGMIYFRIYRKEMMDGHSSEVALKKAIDWGIRDEKTVHGFWASGVFSYADIEANYQGLRFYRNFCTGNRPYLKKENGFWTLSALPDIRNFVNGSWDESFLLSYRKPSNWKNVSQVLKEEYCPKFTKEEIQTRFAYYRKTSHQSFSQKYLSGYFSLPRAQSFTALCSEE